jgi:CO dehydrogenase/acetyl-CoA synthase delta subunit
MDKVVKPKRQYIRKKNIVKIEDVKIEDVKIEKEDVEIEEKDKDEIIIKYPEINNIDNDDLKNKIFKILRGDFS